VPSAYEGALTLTCPRALPWSRPSPGIGELREGVRIAGDPFVVISRPRTNTEEDDVEYLVLLYGNEAGFPEPGTPEFDEDIAGRCCMRWQTTSSCYVNGGRAGWPPPRRRADPPRRWPCRSRLRTAQPGVLS
jgi:hypothetical protein